MVIKASTPFKDEKTDRWFTIEEVEPGIWQSIFPERFAHKSQLHASEDDAWGYIFAVIRGEE